MGTLLFFENGDASIFSMNKVCLKNRSVPIFTPFSFSNTDDFVPRRYPIWPIGAIVGRTRDHLVTEGLAVINDIYPRATPTVPDVGPSGQ